MVTAIRNGATVICSERDFVTKYKPYGYVEVVKPVQPVKAKKEVKNESVE